jgi:DNA-binding MarR family transcriptional regulator
MKPTLTRPLDFYGNLGQLLLELAAMRTRDLRPLGLDLDRYFLLQAVATGRAQSEAGMVRLLGRNASFCSRAVDCLVECGWLKKRPRLKDGDSRFRLQLTRKGKDIYEDLQFEFTERVKRQLIASGMTEKSLRPVCKQVAVLSERLGGMREQVAGPADEETAMEQQQLPL